MPDPGSLILAWMYLHAWILIVVLVIEALVGYPAWLHALIPHPVVWAGYAIGVFDLSCITRECSGAFSSKATQCCDR